jgi:PAS domain S-box-containing protein
MGQVGPGIWGELGAWLLSRPVILALAAGVLLGLLLLASLVGRRQRRREVRELVQWIEELRAGSLRRKPEVDARSALAVVSDAVQRMGQDLGARWREAESAGLRLRALLEVVREDAIFAADRDGRIEAASAGAAELFATGPEGLAGRPLEELFEPGAWKDFVPRLVPWTLPEKGLTERAVLRRTDGGSFEAQVEVRPLRGRNRETGGYILVVRDCAARTRPGEDRRLSEERYRGLVEGLQAGVFVARQGRLTFVNDALASLCGSTPEAMEGRPSWDYVDGRDVLMVREALEELEGHPGERLELRLGLRGEAAGVPVAVRVQLSAVRHEDESAVVGLVHDETALRRVETELEASRSRIDAMLEATSDGILVLGGEAGAGAVHSVNAAFLGRFQLTEPEVLGVSDDRLVELLERRGGTRDRLRGLLRAVAHESRVERITLAGTELLVTIAPLRGRSGAVRGRVLLFRDVTAQRSAERSLEGQVEELRASKESLEQAHRHLSQIHEELVSRSEGLEKLNQELRALDRMKTDLLGNVSHELQTPLVSVRGYTEMVLRERLGPITEEQRKGLQLSLKNIDRMISLIDGLLAIPRIDQEAGRIRLSTFPLRGLLEESVDTLRAEMQARGIAYTSTFERPDVLVHGDRERLLQVFLNLLSNAIKFNRDGGRIDVVVRAGKPGYALVQVRDTGAGIAAGDLERIFDRSYRSATAGGQAGGGLGLSIVRDILRLHGCWIRAESEEGRGTELSFTLPLAGQEASDGREGARPAAGGGAGATRVPKNVGRAARDEQPRLRIIRRGSRP